MNNAAEFKWSIPAQPNRTTFPGNRISHPLFSAPHSPISLHISPVRLYTFPTMTNNTALADVDQHLSSQQSQTSSQTWKTILSGERQKEYFTQITSRIEEERAAGKVIYPKNSEIFNALHLTPFESVKVVIIGQDPYHGPGQAHGLCFSVRPGVPPPPSLVNIFKELHQDLGVPVSRHGYLESWATQGVLLLNATLTVEENKPLSHSQLGWDRFTDTVIRELNARRSGLVFLLWGASAQKKGAMIDRSRHTVLQAPHPSPLSASRGFFGCRHFSQTNDILARQGLAPIEWALPPVQA